jgi:hypothetical protein
MAALRGLRAAVATGAWLLGGLAAAAYPSPADDFVQKGIHEHGRATLTFAIDGALLTITLEAPADNVVGFEHPPRTADEIDAIRKAHDLLNDHRQLFAFPPAAACRLTDLHVKPPPWATAGNASPAVVAPEHDEHADYDATYRFECAHAAELSFVDAPLVTRLRGITVVRAQVATAAFQAEQLLSTERIRVKLR